MFMGTSLFRLAKVSCIILLKIFTHPLRWESSLSSTPIIRFSRLIGSWIPWMIWVRGFLLFAFSLTVVSMFSKVSSAPNILSSISCILLVMYLWFLISFLGFYLQGCLPLVISFIVSSSIFRSWMVLVNSFTCLVVFSSNSIREFCVLSLKAYTCLPVFFCNSFMELFMSFLKSFLIVMRWNFK